MKAFEKLKKKDFFHKYSKQLLFSIILLGVGLKLLMFIKRPDLWWDAASYIGIAKKIWTFGEIGFWNPVRPLILPLILGFYWKLGLDPLLFGRITQIIFASVSVYFIYLVSFKLFKNEKISLLSSFFLAIDPIIFANTQHLLTSTIAMTFSLISVNYYLSSKENNYNNKILILSGIFAALAFMTRLTFIFIAISIGLTLILNNLKLKVKIKKISVFSIAFLITWMPYLILNVFLYKNPLYPYIRGIYEIGLAGGAINYPLTYYLTSIPMVSAITLISVYGIYLLFKKYKIEESQLLLFLFFTGFLYHMFLVEVKVLRYAILFLPFLYILTSYSVINISKNNIMKILVILLIIISVNQNFVGGINNGYSYSIKSFLQYSQTENQKYLEENFYDYFENEKYYGVTVLSSNPYPLAFSDVKLVSLFFPNIITLQEYERKKETFYVMINMADNYCDPNMDFCKKQQSESNDAFNYILANYNQIYNVSIGGQTHYVFENIQQ